MAAKARPKSAPARARYHHGNLRAALVEATERLIEESGPESVTVREAARRAGVSSGAPFRHFPNRTALMTAVAEQAMTRLLAEVDRALKRTVSADPLTRCTAFGEAYFRWVLRNPTQFRVISARNLIDFEGSKTLTRDNNVLRAAMTDLLEAGRRAGLFHYSDVQRAQLATRALVYGVARMYVDEHLAQWDVPARGATRAMRDVFALFLDGLSHGRRTVRTVRRAR
jgi:AcrR family transcriptional regulator